MTPPGLRIQPCASPLELEQARDLRRSVLCGELHYGRELVDDGQDGAEGAWLGLAWAGSKPVGTLRLQRQGAWLLEHLAVLPAWRRQGVGSALLRAALEQARAKGAAQVLACGPQGVETLFGRLGFKVLRREGALSVLGIELK